jgi:hypothetical protein
MLPLHHNRLRSRSCRRLQGKDGKAPHREHGRLRVEVSRRFLRFPLRGIQEDREIFQ